jgi:hypothetical protein
MKVTLKSTQDLPGIPLSQMKNNTFARLVQSSSFSSWCVGDIVYLPVIGDQVSCLRDDTWGSKDNPNFRIEALKPGDQLTITI